MSKVSIKKRSHIIYIIIIFLVLIIIGAIIYKFVDFSTLFNTNNPIQDSVNKSEIIAPNKTANTQFPNYLWVKNAGGNSYDEGRGIATDSSGNVYLTGTFQSSSITFGSTTLTNAGSYDIFTVKLSNSTSVNSLFN